jgi:GAF domain-containing protein
VKFKVVWSYTLMGVLFGMLFPLTASLYLITQGGYQISLQSFLSVQQHHSLTWMIDTAPLFLGLFACLAGLRQAKVIKLNQELNEHIYQQDELTKQLEALRIKLEKSVEKQVVELKAAAQVARDANAIRDLDRLLEETVNLISERFGFYHAGIFLIDTLGEYAILSAASSEGGKRMLTRGHKLPVGKVGIVGYVADKATPRIALDVGADAVFFNNPDLPQTRSEMALPLISRQKILGVLDVQSVEASAFTDEDVAIIQTLADQVALAIDNARLFADSQIALKELENLNKRLVTQSWRPRLARGKIAYSYDRLGVKGVPSPGEIQLDANHERVISLPITFRGQKLGLLSLCRENNQPEWSSQEMELMKTAVGQLGLTLENARMLEDMQRQASRERLVADMTSKLWASADINTIVRTAVEELGSSLDVSEAMIQLEVPGLQKINVPTPLQAD